MYKVYFSEPEVSILGLLLGIIYHQFNETVTMDNSSKPHHVLDTCKMLLLFVFFVVFLSNMVLISHNVTMTNKIFQ